MTTGFDIVLYSAVERVDFRLKGPFYVVLSSFCYSRETRPSGSDSHGCLTLHFAKNHNERSANSLKSTLSTAVFRIMRLCSPRFYAMLGLIFFAAEVLRNL
jgi:hypothetical protein